MVSASAVHTALHLHASPAGTATDPRASLSNFTAATAAASERRRSTSASVSEPDDSLLLLLLLLLLSLLEEPSDPEEEDAVLLSSPLLEESELAEEEEDDDDSLLLLLLPESSEWSSTRSMTMRSTPLSPVHARAHSDQLQYHTQAHVMVIREVEPQLEAPLLLTVQPSDARCPTVHGHTKVSCWRALGSW